MKSGHAKASQCRDHRLRRISLIATSIIMLPLFLSGCNKSSDDDLPQSIGDDLGDAGVGGSNSSNSTMQQATSTTLPTGVGVTTSITTSTGTTQEAVIPTISGSVGVQVNDPDTFLQDEVSQAAIIKGIARAHEVPESYVIANFAKTSTRLLAGTSLRRLIGSVIVDYIIRVVQALVNLREELDRVATVAAQVTMVIIDRVLKEVVQEVARLEGPNSPVVQQLVDIIQVTEFAEPQTITTTTSTPTTTVATTVAPVATTVAPGGATAASTTTMQGATTNGARATTAQATTVAPGGTTMVGATTTMQGATTHGATTMAGAATSSQVTTAALGGTTIGAATTTMLGATTNGATTMAGAATTAQASTVAPGGTTIAAATTTMQGATTNGATPMAGAATTAQATTVAPGGTTMVGATTTMQGATTHGATTMAGAATTSQVTTAALGGTTIVAATTTMLGATTNGATTMAGAATTAQATTVAPGGTTAAATTAQATTGAPGGTTIAAVATTTTTEAPTTTTEPPTTTTTTTLSPAQLSQFLIQSTFGTTRTSLADATQKQVDHGSLGLKEWISAQVALPIESHRAYYRAGANPHLHHGQNVRIGNPRDKCKKGSRWHNFVFTKQDIGKQVTIDGLFVKIETAVGNGTLVVRSEIDPSGGGNGNAAYWADTNAFEDHSYPSSYSCSNTGSGSIADCNTWTGNACNLNGWFSADQNFCEQKCYNKGMGWSPCGPEYKTTNIANYYICKVQEGVGAPVTMDANSNCNNAETTMDNILIWFASASSADVEDISSGSSVFQNLHLGQIAWNGVDKFTGFYLLAADVPSACSFKEIIYVNASIGYLRHDVRLELIDNSLDSPGGAVDGAQECPTVVRTFVNENSCVKKTTCYPLANKHFVFQLNPTNLQAFKDIDDNYLFEVTGLSTEASPCKDSTNNAGITTSRWKKLDCSDSNVDCTLTDTSDHGIHTNVAKEFTKIVDELKIQIADIRDVNVNCDALKVPHQHGGTDIKVAVPDQNGGTDVFQHIALDEHNVYDFTDWVDNHPGTTSGGTCSAGGTGACTITQWTANQYRLEYPSSHDMQRWHDEVTSGTRIVYIGLAGDTIDFANLPTSLKTSGMTAHFDSSAFTDSSYFQSCGSPGETANDPEQANRFYFWYTYVDANDKHYDEVLDNPNSEEYGNLHAKMVVWTAVSWHAQDQLRQRMAWALSQILVTSAPGFGFEYHQEFWPNYYDIMLRHAFGNYRDLLKEVTYSPVMGDYLTFKGSKSYDYKKFFPDENYAREIMQLFTIGLWKLNEDGSWETDSNGYGVPTYDNTQIMSFSRIFTAFDEELPRSNIEAVKGLGAKNNIDPMRIDPIYRDGYPKSDLYNGFIGDHYPLCSDLNKGHFLDKGRKYVFIGHKYDPSREAGVVATLASASPLHQELCGSSDANACTYALDVELQSTHTCYNDECKMDTVYVVKVGTGYYEYQHPECVNLYFYNGRMAKEIARFGHDWYGRCRNPDTPIGGTSCCTPEVSGSRDTTQVCGYPRERVRFSVAEGNCADLGTAPNGANYEPCIEETIGSSCDYNDVIVWTPEACQVEIDIDGVGWVTSQYNTYSAWNNWPVFWENNLFPTHDPNDANNNCPIGCTTQGEICRCEATVGTSAVFSSVPTKADLIEQCFIGAFPPASGTACDHCSGDVKAYTGGGAIDENTIFECEGKYYKNLKSMVTVPGGFSFRNPPSFIIYRNELEKGYGVAPFPTLQSCQWEIDALLDQLFHHQNTAPFVVYRLIQRFGNSNPSPTYISDCATAFKTGAYDGAGSGLYGDLRSTLNCILLHPEARNPSTATDGSMREPIVKFIHALRALEYQEGKGRDVYLNEMANHIGQEFGEQPTVFNFFVPAYQPPTFTGTNVAPEFQLFTPPLAIGWVNGLMSYTKYGITECDEGFSYVSGWFCGSSYSEWYMSKMGPGGTFNLPQVSLDDTLDELDLLLTGGRMTNKAAVKSAIQAATGDDYELARKAVLLLPEFHTTGITTVLGTRPIVTPPVIPASNDYKAVVMLFMHGGADTFNLVVPQEDLSSLSGCGSGTTLQSEYEAIRGDIKLKGVSKLLLVGGNLGQPACDWGVHTKLPFFKTLLDDGDLAFITNIGPLVEPISKHEFVYGGKEKCVGLFSHQDQQTASYTLKCQTAGTSPKGNGGRMSDALVSRGKRAESFSVVGTSAWSQGVTTDQQIIDKNSGAVRLQHYADLNPLLQSINDQQYTNIYANEYAKGISSFVESSEVLGQILDASVLSTTFDKGTLLSRQFYQVARLIKAWNSRKAERDFFFTSVGGFDAHSNAAEILETLFTEINDATQELVTELKATPDPTGAAVSAGTNMFNNVVIASQSDFARSLTTNGAGTDHAWAGQYWAIGGKVNGGTMLNDFPTSLAADNEMDAGRGRQIPKYPWENMMVPIAKWMGVHDDDLTTVFPNMGNFDSSLIIDQCTMFDCAR